MSTAVEHKRQVSDAITIPVRSPKLSRSSNNLAEPSSGPEKGKKDNEKRKSRRLSEFAINNTRNKPDKLEQSSERSHSLKVTSLPPLPPVEVAPAADSKIKFISTKTGFEYTVNRDRRDGHGYYRSSDIRKALSIFHFHEIPTQFKRHIGSNFTYPRELTPRAILKHEGKEYPIYLPIHVTIEDIPTALYIVHGVKLRDGITTYAVSLENVPFSESMRINAIFKEHYPSHDTFLKDLDAIAKGSQVSDVPRKRAKPNASMTKSEQGYYLAVRGIEFAVFRAVVRHLIEENKHGCKDCIITITLNEVEVVE